MIIIDHWWSSSITNIIITLCYSESWLSDSGLRNEGVKESSAPCKRKHRVDNININITSNNIINGNAEWTSSTSKSTSISIETSPYLAMLSSYHQHAKKKTWLTTPSPSLPIPTSTTLPSLAMLSFLMTNILNPHTLSSNTQIQSQNYKKSQNWALELNMLWEVTCPLLHDWWEWM